MKFIDFFAGIGGIRTGMEMAGHECVGFCESEKHAVASYTSMHLLSDAQREHLAAMPFKKRQKEILNEEYRNGEWYSDDIQAVRGNSIPKADCWCGGFPCFSGETLILTYNGYKRIDSVEVGDKVLSHTGHWRTVTSVMSRDNAELWEVKGFGILPTTTTAEHPYYVTKDGKNFDFVPVSKLADDYWSAIKMPVDVVDDNHSAAWWYIAGRYLADGWTVERRDGKHGGRVVIACNDKKLPTLMDMLGKAGLHGSVVKEKTCNKVHIARNQLFEDMQMFGKYAHGKTVPGYVMCLPNDKAEAFYDGYMSGDGRINKEEATSVSPSLILGMAVLAAKIGKQHPGIYVSERPSKCFIAGRECNQRNTYTFRISERSRKSHASNGYICRRLDRPINTGRYGKVYNISVETDESYIANGAIVHNCQDVSCAGSQLGFAGKRSSLFFEIIRILKEQKEEDRPEWLLLENVKNLLSVNNGWDFANVLASLGEVGYDCQWQLFDSQDFGVPQHRERVYIIGHLRRRGPAKILPLEGTDGEDCAATKWAINVIGTLDPKRNSQMDILGTDGLCQTLDTMSERKKIAIPVAFNRKDGVKGEISAAHAVTASDWRGLNRNQDQTAVMELVPPENLDTRRGFNMRGAVHSVNGVSRTLIGSRQGSGSGNEPKVAIPVLTPDRAKKRQNGRRFKEDGEAAFTLTAQDRHGVAIAVNADAEPLGVLRNVRSEYGKKIRRQYEDGELDISRHEFLEKAIREDGMSNTLDSVQKDNYLAEKVEAVGGVYANVSSSFNRGILDGVSRCLKSEKHDASVALKVADGDAGKAIGADSGHPGMYVRLGEDCVAWAVWYEKYGCYIVIRKLTPRECFRLQGFPDYLFDRAEFVNSDSQLYKQAGNGVTVNVVYAIAKALANQERA